jgi:hypothetical protein
VSYGCTTSIALLPGITPWQLHITYPCILWVAAATCVCLQAPPHLTLPVYYVCLQATPHYLHHHQQQQQLELCPTWSREQRVGYGLQNLGQTCYLNSVLQCLAHTPPLANLCLDSAFSSGCTLGNQCMACALERQLRAMLGRPKGATAYAALRPTPVVERLGLISRQLRLGRQEDAQVGMGYAQAIKHSTRADTPTCLHRHGLCIVTYTCAHVGVDMYLIGYDLCSLIRMPQPVQTAAHNSGPRVTGGSPYSALPSCTHVSHSRCEIVCGTALHCGLSNPFIH